MDDNVYGESAKCFCKKDRKNSQITLFFRKKARALAYVKKKCYLCSRF